MKTSGCWMILLGAFFYCSFDTTAQSVNEKPRLIVRVDSENLNVTQPASVTTVNVSEIQQARALLVRKLSETFTIVPESDTRDCIELGVVLERLHTTSGSHFVGSSVIAVGKGKDDLLVTHNPIVESTLEKVSAAIVFQLSVMRLQASFPVAHHINP